METSVIKINDKEYEKKYDDEVKYYLDKNLRIKTDDKIIKQLDKNDKDFFAIVDGIEGCGKSWFSIQWGKYVDNSLNLSRIVFTPEEFKQAIFKAKPKQCIIYDEAFTGLGSRSSLSAINRYLVSLSMQIRQKNLFVILVLPSVFLLDKYFVMFRAKALVHIYENKGIRGYFRVYNNKKIKRIILLGKQTFSYPKSIRTKFKGRFYGRFGLGDKLKDEYLKKKAKALEEAEKNPMSASQIRFKEQRDVFLFLIRKLKNFSYRQLESFIADYGIDISYPQIRNICAKFGEPDLEEDGEPNSETNILQEKISETTEKNENV